MKAVFFFFPTVLTQKPSRFQISTKTNRIQFVSNLFFQIHINTKKQNKTKRYFISEILFVLPVLNFIITFFFPPLIGTPAVDDEVNVQLHSGYFFRQLKMKFILSNIVSSEFYKSVQTLCAYYEFLLDHNLQCSQKSRAFSVLFQQQLCSFGCSTARVMQCRLDDWLGN